MNTTIDSMRDKDYLRYTAVFWWTTGLSPVVIPYNTIDGVLRKFREEGGTSYTLENNYLRGTHRPADKTWVLTIKSHHMSADEGRYEED